MLNSPTEDPLLAGAIAAMQHGAELIAYTLPPGGDWRPVAAALRADGNMEVVQIDPDFLSSAEAKQRLAGELAKLVGRKKCSVFVIVCSAWMKSVAREEVSALMRKGLKDEPDKKEVLHLRGFAVGREVGYIAEITRKPGEHPQLGPWQEQKPANTTTDRYAPGIVEALQAWLN